MRSTSAHDRRVPSFTQASFAALLVAGGLLAAACGGGSGPAPLAHPVLPAGTAGLTDVGYGTDVFGKYATEENRLGQVLDANALNAAGWLVANPNVAEYDYDAASGSTISEYMSSLAVKVGLSGSYSFFSGEAQAAFSQDAYRKEGYSYVTIAERLWKSSLKIDNSLWTSRDRLRPFLTPAARAAIDGTDPTRTWTGDDVITTFGTHVIDGVYLGGRMDYHLAIKILSTSYQSKLEAYAKAELKATLASVTVTSDIDVGSKTTMDGYARVGPSIVAKGGAAQYAHPEDDAMYQAWKASLDANPAFCGIVSGALTPLYDLASTEARRTELRRAFEAYASTQATAFAPYVVKVIDLQVLDAGSGISVTPPAGYDLLTALDGTTVNGFVNYGLANDTGVPDHLYLAVKTSLTADPVGLSDLHLDSEDVDVRAALFPTLTHDQIYGTGAPGCLANAAVDLDANACGVASLSEGYLGCRAIYVFNGGCSTAAPPLRVHYAIQPSTDVGASRCVVLGDEVSVDANQPAAARRAHIHWAPQDINGDGTVDAADADWVLDHVRWIEGGQPRSAVNLNGWKQSFARWDWWGCLWPLTGGGWDDGWINPRGYAGDAQYLGYCLK